MGQGTSKPASSSAQHVFTSDTPVRFSQEVLNKLEGSNESDRSRALNQELQIQSRVAAELQRLASEQDALLRNLTSEPPPSSSTSTTSPSSSSLTKTSKTSSSSPPQPKWPTVSDPSVFPDPSTYASKQPRSPPLPSLLPPSDTSKTASTSKSSASSSSSSQQENSTPSLTRASVQASIDSLKEKLKERKLKEEVSGDKEVERAKGELVRCLMEKDRRPLDCWSEVRAFRREVGRLEEAWVGRVLE